MSAEGGEALRLGRDEVRFLLTSEESGGEAIAFEVEMPAGGGPPALHRHPSVELYRIVEGELVLHLADAHGEVHRRTLGPGEVGFIPGGAEHTIRNESEAPARAHAVLVPGGELEGFARAAAELSGSDPLAVARLAEEHGIEVTRPL